MNQSCIIWGYQEELSSTRLVRDVGLAPSIDVDQRDCVPLGLEDDHSMGCNRRKTEAWEVKDAPKIIMSEMPRPKNDFLPCM